MHCKERCGLEKYQTDGPMDDTWGNMVERLPRGNW